MTEFTNRIIEHGVKPASEFLANPQNPRKHPQKQRDAVKGSLSTLGWIAPVIELSNGYLLDGHERIWQAMALGDSTPVPYIKVDLEEHEARLALATFDYITYLAEYDNAILDDLLQDVNTDSPELQSLLSDLASKNNSAIPSFEALDDFKEYDEDIDTEYCCPKCNYKWSGKPNG